MIRPLSTAITLLLAVTLAGGCGWHLRGTEFLPPDLKTLHLSTRDPDSDFAELLRRSITASGISIPKNATDAQYALVILAEDSEKRTASVNASARVSELQLTESVDFLILSNQGETLVPVTTVRSERIFEYNENNVLATEDERSLIVSEMHRELVRQVLNSLRQLKYRQADAAAP